jgi:uncharacterized LabA/DUF88 family protein
MHVAAFQHGMAPSVWEAVQNRICDYAWKIDFGKLHEFVAGNEKTDIGRAVLYGSRPPANDSLWSIAQRMGFEVVVHDRNVANKEKKIDTTIVRDITKDSYERMRPSVDEVTLVAGDGDYLPSVEDMRARGFKFDLVFWGHANSELRRASSSFINLDPYLENLALTR